MHDFIVSLIQLGACIQGNDEASVVDASTLVDQITDHGITEAIRALGDAKYSEAIEKLQEIRFVNLVIDAGTVHTLKTIVCLLTNPYLVTQPVLLSLRENTNFTADDYAILFVELFSLLEGSPIVICSVVVDNLPAQSSGLERVLAESPILHVKCFAHMTNLILVNSQDGEVFMNVMAELGTVQRIFRVKSVASLIGQRCPKFIRTRWFFMVDTLQYFLNNYEKCNEYLEAFGEAREKYRSALPIEIFELYIMLLPFYCFLSAVESRQCALPEIIPLARMLLTLLRDALGLIRTDRMHHLFRELHIRFLARFMTNNHPDAVAAYSLTLQGRQELRVLERGYSTVGPDHLPIAPSPDLKTFMKGGYSYDDAMASAFAVAGNSDSMFDHPFIPGPPWVTAQESYTPQVDEAEDQPVAQSYREYLSFFHEMADDQRMAVDQVNGIYQTARPRIIELAGRLGLDPEHMGALYDLWLFGPPEEIPFALDEAAQGSVNSLWRIAHRYEKWTSFADLALRLVSSGVSEADAERILSMQKNIAGLHGTRFGRTTMEARIRMLSAVSNRETQQIRRGDVMGVPMGEGDEEKGDASIGEESDSDTTDDSDSDD
jgi:hypothetical protein